MTPDTARERRLAWAAILAFGVGRMWLAASLPLVEDEAYYWTWSRRLDAGYFDHPPGIALLVRLGGWLGRTELAVRLGPVLAGLAVLALLLPHARRPLLFVFCAGTLPIYALGGILATPDVPLLLGWAVALAAALSGRWLAVGLGVGLAGLGKYTGWGLLPLLLVAGAFAHRTAPGDPRGPSLRDAALAVLAALLVVAPNLAWNAAHDWVSVGFQLGHGLDRPPGGSLAFLGAQVGVAGPVFFLVFAAWAAGRVHAFRTAPYADAVLWFASVPVVAFFTLAAGRGAGEANWAAPAWLAAALAVSNAEGRYPRAGWIAAGVGLAISVAVLAHAVRPWLPLADDPFAQLGRGRDLARSVQAWGKEPVYTSRYQEAALISFYAGLETYALPGVDRADQYDYWPTRWPEDGEALFVRPRKSGLSAVVDDFCAARGGQNLVSEYLPSGEAAFRWQVYEVHGCGPKETLADRRAAGVP